MILREDGLDKVLEENFGAGRLPESYFDGIASHLLSAFFSDPYHRYDHLVDAISKIRLLQGGAEEDQLAKVIVKLMDEMKS